MGVSSGETESKTRVDSEQRLSELGSCLVEPKSGIVTAIDSRVAQWLGIESVYSGGRYLSDLLPGVSEEFHGRQTLAFDDGKSQFEVEVIFTSLVGPKGSQVLATLRPIAANEEPAVFCDALTGLPDRRELAKRWDLWCSQETGKPTPRAALFLDLDNFKQINDRYGHTVGDRLLQSLANRWQGCVREGDLLARYGGDEFVVLLSGFQTKQELEPIIARLTAATTEPIEIDGKKLTVGVTIGTALAEDTSADLEQLLIEADRDMYSKKGQ